MCVCVCVCVCVFCLVFVLFFVVFFVSVVLVEQVCLLAGDLSPVKQLGGATWQVVSVQQAAIWHWYLALYINLRNGTYIYIQLEEWTQHILVQSVFVLFYVCCI